MQPATIRRLLVFGVCLVAVSCLYLVPSVSGTSSHIGASSRPHDARTTPPGPATGDLSSPDPGTQPSANSPGSAGMPSTAATQDPPNPGSADPRNSAGSTEPTDPRGSAGHPTQRPAVQRLTAGESKPAATAVDSRADHAPPAAINRLWSTGTDPESLSIAWSAASDDRGSVWYEVWVNGFNVTSTQQPEATVGWFNDSSTHVVQVRAVDLAGNRGPWSPTLMVTRPSPPADSDPVEKSAEKSAANTGANPTVTPSESGSPKEDNS